jgi:hypothetical protein
MLEERCSDDEAFEMLRLASQRSNVKVHDLARALVTQRAGQPLPPAG